MKEYNISQSLPLNNFTVGAPWKFGNDYAELVGKPGKIRLHFSPGKLFMVASADNPISIKITVDGKIQPGVTVQVSQLYTLFDSNDYRKHIIEIDIPAGGFKAFTFTFG